LLAQERSQMVCLAMIQFAVVGLPFGLTSNEFMSMLT